MIKRFFLTILIVFVPFFAYAKKEIHQDLSLKWIESIPIFPKLEVDKPNTIEFDSVNGKLLIVNVYLDNKEVYQMISFYNEFFQNQGWLKLNKNKDDLTWEKEIGRNRKKQFTMKRKNSDKWAFNYVVENF